MKVIYLKDGDLIRVSQYKEIRYSGQWVHILSDHFYHRQIEKSIPINNIKVIQDE